MTEDSRSPVIEFKEPVKRVTQLCFSKAKGGLEMSVVSAATLFAKRGYHSSVICMKGSFIEQALSKVSGIEICAISVNRRYVDWRASMAIRYFIRKIKTDTILLHSLRDIWLTYPALWMMNTVRLVGICHMSVRNVNKKDLLHWILYRRFQHIVALCEAQKKELLECIPFPEEKCSVIPNGLDIQRFYPKPKNEELRKAWNVEPDQLVIGYVGRLDRQKGIIELITALKLINIPSAKLIIVGDETVGEFGFKDELSARIAQLGIGDQVTLIPGRSDIPEVMSAFDIFIMPSYAETFGVVLLEAMACGLPCISTNVGGPVDILKSGEIGLLVEPKSPESLADAITMLVQSQKLREEFGSLGRRTVVERYDQNVVFERLEAVVQDN